MYKYFINLKVLILILLSQVGVAGYAQDAGKYPNKSITFIASSAPGGTTDFTARVLAQPLGLALGQTIVVDNKLKKNLKENRPNFTLMNLGFILKLKELKCPESSYSYLIKHVNDENKKKYGL